MQWGCKGNGQYSRKSGNKLLRDEMGSQFGWEEQMVVYCKSS